MARTRAGDRLTLAYIPSAQLEPLITIKQSDSLVRAWTEMELGDFSQLPVMRGSRVVGVVSWQSIGRALTRKPTATIEDCLETDFPKKRLHDDLLEAIEIVNRHGYVLVTGAHDSLVGIVTSADLGEALADLAQPFLYFGRLEESLRAIFDLLRERGELTPEDVGRALRGAPRDLTAPAQQFTLGDLVTVLTEKVVWSRLTGTFERVAIQRSLQQAVATRNRLMHFRALSQDDERTVDGLRNLVRVVASILEDLRAAA